MEDFPTLSRMPGSDNAFGAEAFEPGEIAGMRSAGVILLATAALGLLGWVVQPGSPPLAAMVDIFLGVQLLRLRHNWRAWALVRAWIGIALGAVLGMAGVFGSGGPAAATLGLGQIAYAGSLLLLLFGAPTMRRVLVGRVVFGLSIVLTTAGIAFSVASRTPDATSSRSRGLAPPAWDNRGTAFRAV
jgi:hypothetical protein